MRRHGEGRGVIFGGRAARVAHDGGELRKKYGEAVDGCAILVVSARDVRPRFRGEFGRRRRVAGNFGRLIFISEEQFAPGFLQMPLSVVDEHTAGDVPIFTQIARAVPMLSYVGVVGIKTGSWLES